MDFIQFFTKYEKSTFHVLIAVTLFLQLKVSIAKRILLTQYLQYINKFHGFIYPNYHHVASITQAFTKFLQFVKDLRTPKSSQYLCRISLVSYYQIVMESDTCNFEYRSAEIVFRLCIWLFFKNLLFILFHIPKNLILGT